jgi:hypothetical protein
MGGDQLLPAFDFGEPNQSVHIAEEEIVITGSDGKVLFDGKAEFRLRLFPQPRILAHVTNRNSLACFMQESSVLELKRNACKVRGFTTAANFSSSGEMSATWCPSKEPIIGVGNEETQMTRLVFHLFNFVPFCGAGKARREEGEKRTCICCLASLGDVWSLELRSVPGSDETFEKLRSEGGYRLTHIGCLKRGDGSFFSGKEAFDTLDMLGLFLSFAKGAWCKPICAVGLDESDNRVWESWSSPKGSWSFTDSWFDPHHSKEIEDLFPGFVKCFLDEDWGPAFREVIYWYLIANDSSNGIDTGIILTQTAIERLSFEYAVKKRKLIETEGFKKLLASDKFRLLFSSLDIPIGITSNTPDLEKMAKEFNWLDAPHAMTEVRNSLVHPEHKRRGRVRTALFDTWKLGLWYLELALLRLCGYSGTYGNRLVKRWAGEVEDVPWKKGD